MAQYPLINGRFYSFSSIELVVAGVPVLGCKAINYKPSLKKGVLRGTGPHKLGRTRGDHDATGDIELYRATWDILRPQLAALGGGGYGEADFLITVSYGELLMPITTDTLEGVSIEEADYSNQQGTDPTTVKLTLDIMALYEGGVPIVSPIDRIGI